LARAQRFGYDAGRLDARSLRTEAAMARRRLLVATRFTVVVILLAWQARPVRADHTEVRQFSILVDGKEAGQSQMTIIEQNNGAVYVSANAKVQVQQLIGSYTFVIEGQEWWQGGKLIGLKAFCNDNGKKCDLLVSNAAGQLLMRVNGQDRVIRSDVWTTSYWKLADARFHNKPVPILAVDNGQERTGQLQYLGAKQLPVANQLISCYHFRITGAGSPIDLWYDQHHRLVRREFTESGHKTIVQLVGKK
jgi:hypothetical protein